MVSPLNSRSSGLGSSPGWGHCVVFLVKIRYSHSASLHPDVQMGTGKAMLGANHAMDQNPIQGGVEILSVASCYKNQDKLWLNEPLGLYADFPFTMRVD